MNISDLTGSTLYYFRVKSGLAQNNVSGTDLYIHDTAGHRLPPPSSARRMGRSPILPPSHGRGENADRQVEYGLTINYGVARRLPTAYGPSHGVTIIDTAPNDASIPGEITGYSRQYSISPADFATPDTTAPVFLVSIPVTASQVTATVTWTTNEISSSRGIEWEPPRHTAAPRRLIPVLSPLTQTVTVPQAQLLPLPRSVARCIQQPRPVPPTGFWTSSRRSFPPSRRSTLTGTSAALIFSTDEPSTSQIEYGTSISYGTGTTLDPTLVTTHTPCRSVRACGN